MYIMYMSLLVLQIPSFSSNPSSLLSKSGEQLISNCACIAHHFYRRQEGTDGTSGFISQPAAEEAHARITTGSVAESVAGIQETLGCPRSCQQPGSPHVPGNASYRRNLYQAMPHIAILLSTCIKATVPHLPLSNYCHRAPICGPHCAAATATVQLPKCSRQFAYLLAGPTL